MTTQQELAARYGETARASRTRWLAGLLVMTNFRSRHRISHQE